MGLSLARRCCFSDRVSQSSSQDRSTEGSNSTLWGPKIDPRRLQNQAKIAKAGARSDQERPKSVTRVPKSGPRLPKSAPRALQERPRASQERPRASQERPRAPQESPKSSQRHPREPSEHHFEARMLEKRAFRKRAVAQLGQEACLERFSVDFRSMHANAEP